MRLLILVLTILFALFFFGLQSMDALILAKRFLRTTTAIVGAFACVVIILLLIRLFFELFPSLKRKTLFLTCAKSADKLVTWKTFEVLFLAITVAGGLAALKIYRETNSISLLIALEDRDRELRSLYLSDAKMGPSLMQVFADTPAGLPEASKSPVYVQCSKETRAIILARSQEYVQRASFPDHWKRENEFSESPPLEWTNAPELYEAMWSPERVSDPKYHIPRAIFMHAIDYLYIVHDAIHARNLGYFNKEEYGMWTAYVNDLSTSPFFWTAIIDGTMYGYMMNSVESELKRLVDEDPKSRCFALTFHPDFLKTPVPKVNEDEDKSSSLMPASGRDGSQLIDISLENWVAVATLVITGTAITFAAVEFYRKEKWNQKHSLSKFMEEFARNTENRSALNLLDYEISWIDIFPENATSSTSVADEAPNRLKKITYQDVIDSLTLNEVEIRDLGPVRFRIRDIIDHLLFDLERLNLFIKNGLYSKDEVHSFLYFYLSIFAGKSSQPREARHITQFKKYIVYFDWNEARQLIERAYPEAFEETDEFFKS